MRRPAVLIPALDAVATIGSVVREAREHASRVLVVDDGSTDGTAREAIAAGAEVHVHRVNRGKGAALRSGFGVLFDPDTDQVITMDADGQHLASEIPELLEPDADLVLGTRTRDFADMTPLRRVSNELSTRAIARFAGRRLSDVQTGFRRYSRRLVEAAGMPEDGFDAESAVVVRAARLGFAIAEVPVRLGFADGRSVSHFVPLPDGLRIARAVVWAWATTART